MNSPSAGINVGTNRNRKENNAMTPVITRSNCNPPPPPEIAH